MDSYVVRIYRRDPKDPRRLVGVVEQAGEEASREQAFHDLAELMEILASTRTTRRISKSAKQERRGWSENKQKQ
jgi:hypothetical protein